MTLKPCFEFQGCDISLPDLVVGCSTAIERLRRTYDAKKRAFWGTSLFTRDGTSHDTKARTISQLLYLANFPVAEGNTDAILRPRASLTRRKREYMQLFHLAPQIESKSTNQIQQESCHPSMQSPNFKILLETHRRSLVVCPEGLTLTRRPCGAFRKKRTSQAWGWLSLTSNGTPAFQYADQSALEPARGHHGKGDRKRVGYGSPAWHPHFFRLRYLQRRAACTESEQRYSSQIIRSKGSARLGMVVQRVLRSISLRETKGWKS